MIYGIFSSQNTFPFKVDKYNFANLLILPPKILRGLYIKSAEVLISLSILDSSSN
jgi:hypothetical protein